MNIITVFCISVVTLVAVGFADDFFPSLGTLPVEAFRNNVALKPNEPECAACHKVDMVINMTNFPWFLSIMSPVVANIYRCQGTCLFANECKSDKRWARDRVSVRNVPEVPVAALSCVPIRKGPLLFSFKEEGGGYKYGEYSDLIVEECGCV